MKLLTLKPLTPYFFGYKETFGKRGDNYFVRSALYPQQSAILGMLRKEILIQEGLLKRGIKDEWVDMKDRDKAIELVGIGKFYFKDIILKEKEKSRKEVKFNSSLNLGKIKKIYPVILKRGSEFFFEAPDIEEIGDDLFVKFDYKKGVWGKVFGNKGNVEEKSNVFIPFEIAGNSKKEQKDSYFKKVAYRLKEGFEFCIFVDVDYNLKDSVVKLGADNSLFEMKVEEVDYSLDDIEIKLPIKTDHRLTLIIGDSYIDNLKCDFAITDEIEFRTIKQKRKFYKTDALYLYKKGSLIINNQTQIVDFTKIGFNYTKEVVK